MNDTLRKYIELYNQEKNKKLINFFRNSYNVIIKMLKKRNYNLTRYNIWSPKYT